MFNIDDKIKIRNNIIFVVKDEDEVTVRNSSKLYKLKGDEVREILIPLIDSLYKGSTINELYDLNTKIDKERLIDVIENLFNRGWLTNKDYKTKYVGQVYEENSYKSIGVNYESVKAILNNKTIAILGFSDIAVQLAESLIDSNIINIKLLIPKNNEVDIKSSNEKLKLDSISIEYYDILNEQIIENFIKGSDILALFEAIENKVIEESINKICIDNGVAWIRGIVKNFITQIGPLVVPGYTACLQCYNSRVYSNLNYYDENVAMDKYLKEKGFNYYEGDEITKPSLLMGIAMMNSQIVQYFTKDLTWNFPKSIEGVLEYDTYNMNFEVTKFLKIPRCVACSKEIINKPTIKSWMEPYNYQE